MSDKAVARLREALETDLNWLRQFATVTEASIGARYRLTQTAKNGIALLAALAPARECVYTEDGDGVWKCSACKWDVSDDLTESTWAYCPHCGARITESRATETAPHTDGKEATT